MVPDGGFPPPSQKVSRRIPRPFRDVRHLENNTLVLGSIAKTLKMGSSHVTEDPFVSPASGAAQVTCFSPWRNQALLLSSTLNTSAISSRFFSSFQSVS